MMSRAAVFQETTGCRSESKGEAPLMDELAQAREEIRRGNHASAKTILDGILEGPEKVTSHVLFDLTSIYEELFSTTGRYEDLIRIARRCAGKTRHLAEVDGQIHSANALIAIAGAERALGRTDDAERSVRTAERLLGRLPSERFGANSQERVNRTRVGLKSVHRAIPKDALSLSSKNPNPGANSSVGPGEWRTFVSQKNPSGKDVKAWLAMMRRSAGPAESLAIVVDWASSTPRAGNIGATAESFAALVEDLACITIAHPLPFDSQRKLFGVLHDWEQEQNSWLQRLIRVNPKLGLAEKLLRLRRALEEKVQHALNSMAKQLAALESLDSGEILDGGSGQDYQAMLLRLESQFGELSIFVPSPSSTRLNLLRSQFTSIVAVTDRELRRRNELYAKLLEAIAQASNRSDLANLKIAAKQQLPVMMWTRPELQQALCTADDRLLLAELDALENQEREVHRTKLNSVRGVHLANLLFREYGVDLPIARKLVLDRNEGHIDLDGLLDRVLEITRQKRASQQTGAK